MKKRKTYDSKILDKHKSNKKVFINQSENSKKAMELEKFILKNFNFFPIAEKSKLQNYGYNLVKEYVRFMVIKVIFENDHNTIITYPPPLVYHLWRRHILDTNRYDEFSKLINKTIYLCMDTFEKISIDEKKIKFKDTLLFYQYLFLEEYNKNIWDDGFLNENLDYSDENNNGINQINIIKNENGAIVPIKSPSSSSPSSLPSSLPPPSIPPHGNKISIQFEYFNDNAKDILTINGIRSDKPFKKVLDLYCAEKKAIKSSCKFFYGNNQVTNQTTPIELNMKNGDTIIADFEKEI